MLVTNNSLSTLACSCFDSNKICCTANHGLLKGFVGQLHGTWWTNSRAAKDFVSLFKDFQLPVGILTTGNHTIYSSTTMYQTDMPCYMI